MLYRFPINLNYPQKLTLTSPTSGGRSVGIVRSRTQATEFVCYTFELLQNTHHILDIHRAQRVFLFARTTATFGINNRVSETLGIAIKLKVTSHVTNFVKQTLPFLAYGGSSFVKTLN
jgi:hypothetical protein